MSHVKLASVTKVIHHTAPDALIDTALIELVPVAPGATTGSKCAICLDELEDHQNLAQTKLCGHQFHRPCILDSLAHSTRCPVCKGKISPTRGMMPTGTMTISPNFKEGCEGFKTTESIEIHYTIPDGVQKKYNE